MKLLSYIILVPIVFFCSSLSASVLLTESFSGTSLDELKWTTGGWDHTRTAVVSEDKLTLGVSAGGHHVHIRSVDQFNFNQSAVQVDIGVDSFDEIAWNAGSFLWQSMWFNVGTATHSTNVRNASATNSGFKFGLHWRPSDTVDNIFLGGDGNSIGGNTRLSNVPSKISFTVDSLEYTIELSGAVFAEGTFEGLSAMTGTWSPLASYDEYNLLVGIEQRGSGQPGIVASFDSITVIPEPGVYAALVGLLSVGVVLLRRRVKQ